MHSAKRETSLRHDYYSYNEYINPQVRYKSHSPSQAHLNTTNTLSCSTMNEAKLLDTTPNFHLQGSFQCYPTFLTSVCVSPGVYHFPSSCLK